MKNLEILARIYDEELYFKYHERDIVIRSVPHPDLHFYVKFRNGREFKMTYCIEALIIAIRYSHLISKEQYDNY